MKSHSPYASSQNLKNDPLWIPGLSRSELHPLSNINYIYPGAEALPTLTSVLHCSYTVASPGYNHRISESMLSYYCAALTWFRMLWLQQRNGFTLQPEEQRYVEQIASRGYEPPALLAHYLKGFGNTRLPSGPDIRFRLRDRPNLVHTGGIHGWFGLVDATTQPLYQNYPCLAVYANRILAGLHPTETDVWWTLPKAIRPTLAGGVRPSKAMLGYGPRETLSTDMKMVLQSAMVFHGENFPSVNHDISLNMDLLDIIQGELRQVDKLKLPPMPMLLMGSQAQLALIKVEGELKGFKEHVMECAVKIPNEVTFAASAFPYRVVHAVTSLTSREEEVPWLVYKYREGQASAQAWNHVAATGNACRTSEPPLLGLSEFWTTPYSVWSRLDAMDRFLQGR